MADLILRPDLVQRLNEIAATEQRPVDDVLDMLLRGYVPAPPAEAAEDIEARLRADRLCLYERARRYWRKEDNPRQNLTDSELDEQFWVIDHEGIPRLKADRESVDLPHDSLLDLLDYAEANTSIEWNGSADNGDHSREILNTEYTDYLLNRSYRPAVNDE